MDTRRVSIYARKSFLLLGLFTQAVIANPAQPPLATQVDEMERVYQEMMPYMQSNQLEQVSLADLGLEQVLERMVDEQPSVSPAVAKCYAELANGVTTVTLGEMMRVMPELMNFLRSEVARAATGLRSPPVDNEGNGDRAPRPGVSTTASNAIVGKNACDLTPVLAGIAALKKLINRVCEKIDELRELMCEKFEQTWTILADIDQDIFDTKTLLCDKFEQTWTILADIDQDIFDTKTLLCDKFEQTWTILAEILKADCPKVPLTQEDVVGGVILLDEEGINYCMCTNIDGDIVISGANVTLDMNDRVLSGTLNVCADDVIVRDGKVKPPAPANAAEAAIAAVTVKDSVRNARLLNLLIECEDSVGLGNDTEGRNGRAGIENRGEKTFIFDCCIRSGAGAKGADNFGGVGGEGGNGGSGIWNVGDRAQIFRCLIQTGSGGNGGEGDGNIPNNFNGGNGGNSGVGIDSQGAKACIGQTKVMTGVGGAGGVGDDANGGNGGASGKGIWVRGDENQIAECVVTTDVGGVGGVGSDNGGNGGDSGIGIDVASDENCVLDSKVTTNRGGNGGNGENAGGDGGSSGHGIRVYIGEVQQAEHNKIVRNNIITGDGGNTGSGNVNTDNGGNGGHGIFVKGACGTEIRKCVVMKTGSGTNAGNEGGNGGDAVRIEKQNTNDTEVRLCTFSNTGTGGTGTTDGVPGRAVTDLVDDECSQFACDDGNANPTLAGGASAIFSNFAYAIADEVIRYLINDKPFESGKASNKSCNRLDNVYVDCDVETIADPCQEIIDTRTLLCDKFEQTWTILADIDQDIFDTKTLLCDKFEQTWTILADIDQDIFDTTTLLCDKFEQTWTILADIDQDIFDTKTLICDKFEQTWTILAEILKADCPKVPLTQDDVVGGVITLDEEGVNYCMCTNIDGDIVISGANVTLDMNDRVLSGTLNVCADDVIVRDGKVKPPAPTNESEASTAAVTVKDSVRNARLLNLSIENTDSAAEGLEGRAGIDNQGEKTFILDCCIRTGAGAAGAAGESPEGGPGGDGGNGGNGGIGIINPGDRAQIFRCLIQTGSGGDGGVGAAAPVDSDSDGGNGGNGGDSGVGIDDSGEKTCIGQTKIMTGVGGNGGDGGEADGMENVIGGAGGNGGSSGDAINVTGDEALINECVLNTDRAGNGGNGGDGCPEGGDGGTGGSGGAGVHLVQSFDCVLDTKITTSHGGNGGNGGTSVDNVNNGAGGNAGDGGEGIRVEESVEHAKLTRNCIITGSGGNAGMVDNVLSGSGGNGGHGINVNGACGTEIRKCVVMKTGSGTNGGAGLTGGRGGDGVWIAETSNDTEVRLCTFSNTGTGGLPIVDPADTRPGRAVTDNNGDDCSRFACDDGGDPLQGGASVIFSNFAYAIADTVVRYLINGNDGVEGGKSSNLSCNRLDNVYVDCDVEVIADPCQEIIDTRTILCDKFEQTWTILEELDQDIFDTRTILCDKFEQTWTILADIDQDLFDTRTIICDKLEDLLANCDVCSQITEPTTITESGCYCLINDIDGEIVIDADRVTLNLNGFRVDGGVDNIQVNSTDIVIKNGIISNATSNAVTMTNGTNVTIQDVEFVDNVQGINVFTSTCVQILDCTFRGHSDSAIQVDGSDTILVQNVKAFENSAEFEGTFTIMNFENSEDVCVRNVLISRNSNFGENLTGLNFSNCSACQVTQVKVESNDSSGTTIGYNGVSSSSLTFNESSAVDNTATNTAIGFQFDSTETSCILNCVAKRNNADPTVPGSTGRGYLLTECTDCHVQDNLAVGNTGATSIGFEVSQTGALTTAVLGNKSQQHSTNNFEPQADLPVVIFTIATNMYSASPEVFDNLSIV